jgi:hypothetical protein
MIDGILAFPSSLASVTHGAMKSNRNFATLCDMRQRTRSLVLLFSSREHRYGKPIDDLFLSAGRALRSEQQSVVKFTCICFLLIWAGDGMIWLLLLWCQLSYSHVRKRDDFMPAHCGRIKWKMLVCIYFLFISCATVAQ